MKTPDAAIRLSSSERKNLLVLGVCQALLLITVTVCAVIWLIMKRRPTVVLT